MNSDGIKQYSIVQSQCPVIHYSSLYFLIALSSSSVGSLLFRFVNWNVNDWTYIGVSSTSVFHLVWVWLKVLLRPGHLF